MRFESQPVGLDFIDRAPYRFENTAELDATPEQVFDLLADGDAWPKWFRDIKRVTWTTPDPKGVGTKRTVKLAAATVYEYFLVWERGKRYTFRFEGANRPIFKAGIEDYRMEPLPGGRTKFFYGVYLEPAPIVALLGPIGKAIFARMFRKGTIGLQRYLKKV